MVTRVSGRKRPAGFAALGFLLVAAGCQSGGPAAVFGGGQQAPADRISVEELLAYCPSVSIRERNTVYNSYQRGGDGNPDRLVFRAAINDATRSCSYGGGMTSMTIAIAGRVVPGPVGTAGSASMPLRVTVYRDTEMIHDQVHNHQVAVADTAGATQFVFTDTSVSIPNPTARNIRVLVGYDTGR